MGKAKSSKTTWSQDRLKRSKNRQWRRKTWWTINERARRIGHPGSR